MAASRLELPLFQRYHAAARSGKAKSALAKLGLTPTSSSTDDEADVLACQQLSSLVGDADELGAEDAGAEPRLLEQATAALDEALGKTIDANYFIGVELGGSAAFGAAVEAVHATVRQRSADDDAVASACLPPTRWTLCLGVLRIYSPQQLAEVRAALSEELGDAAAARLSVGLIRGPSQLRPSQAGGHCRPSRRGGAERAGRAAARTAWAVERWTEAACPPRHRG